MINIRNFAFFVFSVVNCIAIADECATVDSDYNINLKCVNYLNQYYQVQLNRKLLDPGWLWSLGEISTNLPKNNTTSCASASQNLNLSIPCVTVGDINYQVNLQFLNSTDNNELLWKLDTVVPLSESSNNTVTISRVSGPILLNQSGRGLFSDVMLINDSVLTTYQIANFESITLGKNLYSQLFDRSLVNLQVETLVLDVSDPEPQSPVKFNGDLGDHKFTVLGDTIYMVKLVKDTHYAGIFSLDSSFNIKSELALFGDPDTDQKLDMGITNDGSHIYVQFFYQPTDPNEAWGAKLYKFDQQLNQVNESIVRPESGTFVTGTSIVYVPQNEMGADQDRLQIFSTNKDYGNSSRVGIHTFAITKDLQLIPDSTRTIIEESLDSYFPTGVSWNKKHQLWIVGYTMESSEGAFPTQELGPSFIKIFDADWNELQTISLNNGEKAFRVMTETAGDDIYVSYDEMDVHGHTDSSLAKIEHFTISSN